MSDATRRLFNVDDARRLARRRMPRMMYDFVTGAAGNERAAERNCAAFAEVQLQPRVLVNIEGGSVATEILGQKMSLPFGFAPMGMCALSWPGADRFLAAEAVARGIPQCVSTASSTALEEMQRLAPGRVWFQLYAGTSAEATDELVDRAEAAGYAVLILTVDTPKLSRRIRDQRSGFRVPFRFGPKQVLDFALHPRWSLTTLAGGIPKPMNFETSKVAKRFNRGDSRGATDWDFLDRLRARWTGKLVVKGVMSTADAERIRDAGADAVYVSNHGGRQLDSAPPALAALPAIRAAVGPDYPLIFDSGVRGGEDVVKALALGADFVMLGRPLLYAMGADGARGLASLLDGIAEDVAVTMAQLGCTRLADINETVLAEHWERKRHE